MEAYKAILEALSEAECITYYQTDDKEQGYYIRKMNRELRKMIEEWHKRTGVTLD
jgi:hypothetical protein